MHYPPLQQWSIVIVEFPFAENNGSKRRPALVVEVSGSVIEIVKITSWKTKRLFPGCVGLAGDDLKGTGLSRASIVDLRARTRVRIESVEGVIGRVSIDKVDLRRRFIAAFSSIV